jgi:hypothetical protein
VQLALRGRLHAAVLRLDPLYHTEFNDSTMRIIIPGSITLSALLLFSCWGCGTSSGALPSLIPVNGKVTYKGQPLTKGTIRFEPDGYGRMATGTIQSDGTFVLSTLKKDDGVVAGLHKVSVSDTGPLSKKELIPKKYTDPGTSKLTAEVDSEHTEFTFDLIDGK